MVGTKIVLVSVVNNVTTLIMIKVMPVAHIRDNITINTSFKRLYRLRFRKKNCFSKKVRFRIFFVEKLKFSIFVGFTFAKNREFLDLNFWKKCVTNLYCCRKVMIDTSFKRLYRYRLRKINLFFEQTFCKRFFSKNWVFESPLIVLHPVQLFVFIKYHIVILAAAAAAALAIAAYYATYKSS